MEGYFDTLPFILKSLKSFIQKISSKYQSGHLSGREQSIHIPYARKYSSWARFLNFDTSDEISSQEGC
jgi:hypothetical protein